MIFHTKYPKNVHASLRSAQFFLSAPPLTLNPGSAPASLMVVSRGPRVNVGEDFYTKKQIVCLIFQRTKLIFLQRVGNNLLFGNYTKLRLYSDLKL